MNKEKMIVIKCDCGFRLGIAEKDIEEISCGVWGTINCPQCKCRLNDKISEKVSNES